MVGAGDARLEIRSKVPDAISWEYSWRVTECLRQEMAAFDLDCYVQVERLSDCYVVGGSVK